MEFVFDRTQQDVDRAAELNRKYITGTITADEKTEWAAGIKGALNLSDVNRIEGNVQEIAAEIAASVTAKTWSTEVALRESDYSRILSNLAVIRAGYGIMSDTPEVPAQPVNTFQKWNDVEKILHDVHYVFTHVQMDRFYCGSDVFAGEGIGIL